MGQCYATPALALTRNPGRQYKRTLAGSATVAGCFCCLRAALAICIGRVRCMADTGLWVSITHLQRHPEASRTQRCPDCRGSAVDQASGGGGTAADIEQQRRLGLHWMDATRASLHARGAASRRQSGLLA
jgi:hypothetical protein